MRNWRVALTIIVTLAVFVFAVFACLAAVMTGWWLAGL